MKEDKLKELKKELSAKKANYKSLLAVYNSAIAKEKFADAHKFWNSIEKVASEIKGIEGAITVYLSDNLIKSTEEVLLETMSLKELASAEGSFVATTALMKEIAELRAKLKAEEEAKKEGITTDDEILAIIELINNLPDISRLKIVKALKE